MGLFTKIFGGRDVKEKQSSVEQLLEQLLEKGGFDISCDVEVLEEKENRQTFKIEFYGEDENLFTGKDGGLLDSFQLFIKRSLQHKFPGDMTGIICDCDGFRGKNKSIPAGLG